MSFIRTLVLASALAAAGAVAHAGDISMAGGTVNYHTPDQWLDIMDTQGGDTEARVFQVPDGSPTGTTNLARITVTVKQVTNMGDFQQYVNEATNKAKGLPNYQAGSNQGSGSFVYTAQENGTPYAYTERYWYRDNHAIQLRCVRPMQSQAGAAWRDAFDKGCEDVANHLR